MKYSIFIIFISYIASPKFCLHCTHFIPHKLGNEFSRCKMFPITDTSFLVTEEFKYNYCTTARNLDYMCGEYAKRYFPKDSDTIGGKGGGGGDDDLSGIILSTIQISA